MKWLDGIKAVIPGLLASNQNQNQNQVVLEDAPGSVRQIAIIGEHKLHCFHTHIHLQVVSSPGPTECTVFLESCSIHQTADSCTLFALGFSRVILASEFRFGIPPWDSLWGFAMGTLTVFFPLFFVPWIFASGHCFRLETVLWNRALGLHLGVLFRDLALGFRFWVSSWDLVPCNRYQSLH